MNILMTLDNSFTHDHRVYNEAKSLVDAGYKVTVLAWNDKGMYPENEEIDGIKHDFIFHNHGWRNQGYYKGLNLYKQKKLMLFIVMIFHHVV